MARAIIKIPADGGVNRFQAPSDIRDNEFVTTKNLYPREPGHLVTRPSTAVIAQLSGGVYDGFPIGMQFLPLNAAARFIVYARALDIGGTPMNTTMSAYPDFTPPSTAYLASADFGAVTPYVPGSVAYNGKVYAVGGYGCNSNGKILQRKPDGSVEIVNLAFSTGGNSSLRPHGVANYRDRFVYWDFGPGFESAVVFADPFLPDRITANALATNGGYFLLNPDDGDRLTGGVEMMQTGGTHAQASFLMFKEFSAYLISGEPQYADGTSGPQPGDALYIQIIKMPVNCGCASQDTICRTPFGIIWAGPDDVWFFPEGQVPYRVGTKIRPALQASPANLRYRWHAVYHDGFYKLALFSDGQGPTDDSACGEQWWLDMRSGLPPPGPDSWRECRWYGPMVHRFDINNGIAQSSTGTRCMAIDVRPGAQRGLFTVERGDQAAASSYYVQSFDGQNEHDCVILDSAGLFPGVWPITSQVTEIVSELLTKEFKEIVQGQQLVADSVMEKGLHGCELDLDVTRGGVLGWKWILNSGRSISSEQQTEVLPPSQFLLGSGVLDTGVLSDEDALVALDPAPTRVVGTSLQLQLYSKAGYYIDATNDLFELDVEVAPAVFVRISVSLTRGLYTSVTTLAAHIATRLTAALTAYSITITSSIPTYFVRFTNGSGNTLRFGETFCASANKAKVRQIANALGFTTWDSAPYSGAANVTASEAVYNVNIQRLAINSGLVLHLYTIPRRLL